jgi:hypothetical protein
MPIDPFSEEVFPLALGAARLPRLRQGRPVHPSTLWRWASCGLRGVILETVFLGGVRVTSTDALRRFFSAVQQRHQEDHDPQQSAVCSSFSSAESQP